MPPARWHIERGTAGCDRKSAAIENRRDPSKSCLLTRHFVERIKIVRRWRIKGPKLDTVIVRRAKCVLFVVCTLSARAIISLPSCLINVHIDKASLGCHVGTVVPPLA